jgi:hypothetical protein
MNINDAVEITILPVNEKEAQPHITGQMIDEMLPSSITESLIGAIPFSDISLENIRSERLQKYEDMLIGRQENMDTLLRLASENRKRVENYKFIREECCERQSIY